MSAIISRIRIASLSLIPVLDLNPRVSRSRVTKYTVLFHDALVAPHLIGLRYKHKHGATGSYERRMALMNPPANPPRGSALLVWRGADELTGTTNHRLTAS